MNLASLLPAALFAASLVAHAFARRDLTRAFTLTNVAAATALCAWTMRDGWTVAALLLAFAAGRHHAIATHNLRCAWREHRARQWCDGRRLVMRGHVAPQRIGGRT